MKASKKLLIGALCLVLTGLMIAPAMAQKKAGAWAHFKEGKANVVKSLNLAPEKQKEFNAVEEKFAQQRKAIFEGLKKDYSELEKALAAPKPDEAKVKSMVGSITGSQDNLFNTFKSQRDAELQLLTPVQQGKYLLGMRKLYHESMGTPKTGAKK
jgi:Spy/CpxP family protein refolding chaperone